MSNCGKEEGISSNLKTCVACKLVKYCNRECQVAHRSQHKKECRKRAAELNDEALFKVPPPAEDCPICYLRMPCKVTGRRYFSCCGNMICSGCLHAPVYDNQGNVVEENKCPFCRLPIPDLDEETMERDKKRIEANDPIAIHNRGTDYRDGTNGFPQDLNKALELYHRAGELGNPLAYNSIGCTYDQGIIGGAEKQDKKKAKHYYELAAKGGYASARYNLGVDEARAGNMGKSLKHFTIAVGSGHDGSLKRIQELYSHGYATKEDYMKALQSYNKYLSEIKSPQRDEAAAYDEDYRYY